jgi:hypothetical protein
MFHRAPNADCIALIRHSAGNMSFGDKQLQIEQLIIARNKNIQLLAIKVQLTEFLLIIYYLRDMRNVRRLVF